MGPLWHSIYLYRKQAVTFTNVSFTSQATKRHFIQIIDAKSEDSLQFFSENVEKSCNSRKTERVSVIHVLSLHSKAPYFSVNFVLLPSSSPILNPFLLSMPD